MKDITLYNTDDCNKCNDSKCSAPTGYDKSASKEIDKAIKKFNEEVSVLLKDKQIGTSDIFLLKFWDHIVAFCEKVENNSQGVKHKMPNRGLMAFADKVKKYIKSNNNIDRNSKNSDTLDFESFNTPYGVHNTDKHNQSIKEKTLFLKSVREYKLKNSRVNKIIEQCEKVLKFYSKMKNKEKIKKFNLNTQTAKKIKTAMDYAKKMLTKIRDETRKIADMCQENGINNISEEISNYFSNNETKGLEGWCNKYKDITKDNVRNAFLNMGEFVKSSGKKLFGFGPKIGRSRLKKLVEIINDWESGKNVILI